MTDKPDGKRSRWRRAAWIAAVLLVLYPLSMGPAFWLVDATRDEGVKTCVSVIYAPVGMVFYCSPYVTTVIVWYLGLWVSDDP